MIDTEILILCPQCSSEKVIEQRGMHATTIEVDNPGDEPREIRLKIYTCLVCGRIFNEEEATK